MGTLVLPLHSRKAKELCDFCFFCMENAGVGLIFAGKMPALTCLLNQILKCILFGVIDISRFAVIELHRPRI